MAAKIKINLLGKKKIPAPFGLDSLFEKSGVSPEDLATLKIPAIKVGVIILGFYAAEYIPNSFYEIQTAELDKKQSVLTQKTEAVQKEVALKKEVRSKMEQLTKEEAEVQRQLNIIASLSKNRANSFKTFDTLSLIIPQKVWLNRLEYVDGKVFLEGGSWEYFPINDFVKVLNETVQFQAVTLRSINAEAASQTIAGVPLAAQKVKSFQVEFLLKEKI